MKLHRATIPHSVIEKCAGKSDWDRIFTERANALLTEAGWEPVPYPRAHPAFFIDTDFDTYDIKIVAREREREGAA